MSQDTSLLISRLWSTWSNVFQKSTNMVLTEPPASIVSIHSCNRYIRAWAVDRPLTAPNRHLSNDGCRISSIHPPVIDSRIFPNVGIREIGRRSSWNERGGLTFGAVWTPVWVVVTVDVSTWGDGGLKLNKNAVRRTSMGVSVWWKVYRVSNTALPAPFAWYIIPTDFVLIFVFLCIYIDLYDIDCVLISDVQAPWNGVWMRSSDLL